MYPAELEIKDTTESTTSVSYLNLLLSIGRDGKLHTSIYDKRDDFNFHITNFPFLSSNIPSSPAYGVFISQLKRYARACSSYECFIMRARRLSSKLLKQGYLVERLKSSFMKFYGRYGDLIQQYAVNHCISRHYDPWPTMTSKPIRLSTNCMTFIPILTFTELWVVSMEHLQRVWLASRECLPFRTPGFRHPLWDLLVLQLLNIPCLYSTFHLEYPLVLSRFCLYTHELAIKRAVMIAWYMPYKDRNFKRQTCGKCFYFVICMVVFWNTGGGYFFINIFLIWLII